MILFSIGVLVLVFAFVVFFGAPYLPTKRRQIELALEMLDAQVGRVIVDLGSGDGVFLLAAAKKGATVYGYELNPILCVISKLRCWKYRSRVHIRCANFWKIQLPDATDGVYVFLLTRYMKKLDQKMEIEAERLKRQISLASFTFAIPGKQALEAREAVFLYTYPSKKQ